MGEMGVAVAAGGGGLVGERGRWHGRRGGEFSGHRDNRMLVWGTRVRAREGGGREKEVRGGERKRKEGDEELREKRGMREKETMRERKRKEGSGETEKGGRRGTERERQRKE